MRGNDIDGFKKLLTAEVPPVKLGNSNKTGKCGMCGTRVTKLYPRKVGSVDFMICENCKSIMDM
jgi:hypothetical protein